MRMYIAQEFSSAWNLLQKGGPTLALQFIVRKEKL